MHRPEAERPSWAIPPDPVAYILTKNVQRRNINKSQRAMIIATAYPEARKASGQRDKSTINVGV